MAIDRVGTGGTGSAASRAAAEALLARVRQGGLRAEGIGGAGSGVRAESAGPGVEAPRGAARLAGVQELGVRAQTVESALTETQGLLAELRDLIRAQRGNGSGLEGVRARVGEITESIRRAEARASGEAVESADEVGVGLGATLQKGFVVANVAPGVDGVTGRTTLPPGSVRSVELEVVTSAASADIGLSFGGPQLDLASATSQFRILIEGGLGSQELSFASGTGLSDLVSAINSFTSTTGVEAKADVVGGLVYLRAPAEDGAFVSLRVLDSGGTSGFIHGLAEGSTLFSDTVPSDEFREDSSAFVATIAGQPITIEGNTIVSRTDEWTLRVDVDDLERFNWRGTYNLFRLFAMQGNAVAPGDVPPEYEGVVEAGVGAVRGALGVAQEVAHGAGSESRVIALSDAVGASTRAIRELLAGPVADARARAESAVESVVRQGVQTGWRIDARG